MDGSPLLTIGVPAMKIIIGLTLASLVAVNVMLIAAIFAGYWTAWVMLVCMNGAIFLGLQIMDAPIRRYPIDRSKLHSHDFRHLGDR